MLALKTIVTLSLMTVETAAWDAISDAISPSEPAASKRSGETYTTSRRPSKRPWPSACLEVTLAYCLVGR